MKGYQKRNADVAVAADAVLLIFWAIYFDVFAFTLSLSRPDAMPKFFSGCKKWRNRTERTLLTVANAPVGQGGLSRGSSRVKIGETSFVCAALHHEIVARDMHTKLEMLINMFCTADTRRYPHILGGSVYISVNCSPALSRSLSHLSFRLLPAQLEIIKLIFIRRQAVKNSWDGWLDGWMVGWLDGWTDGAE